MEGEKRDKVIEMNTARLERVMTACMNIIGALKRFDQGRWDVGQWLCVIEFGPKWMESPEFQRLNAIPFEQWPDEELVKYERLREWLRLEYDEAMKKQCNAQTVERN